MDKDRLRNYPSVGAIHVIAIFMINCGGGTHTPYSPTPDEAELDQCLLSEKTNRHHEAEACYSAMCEREPPYQRACYDLSRLLFEIGRSNEAQKKTSEFVLRFPEHALAPVAVKRLARTWAKGGEWDRGIDALEDLAEKTVKSDVHDSVLFHMAELQRKAGRPKDEAGTLRRLIDTYGRWDSQLWDNAIWRLIALNREQGERETEKRLLKRLLDTKEPSWFIASYDSPFHDDAMLRLGRISFEDDDYKRAGKLFSELAKHKTSRLRDEGLIGLAELRLATGRRKDACKLLKKIIVDIPDANTARKAADMSSANKCK
ncbi:MAG: tetratricopeptide repeat protein [Proteobacteria bacterium]|nr:tetratricopeptide repeat protein [Pseudomonadota bacterium]